VLLSSQFKGHHRAYPGQQLATDPGGPPAIADVGEKGKFKEAMRSEGKPDRSDSRATAGVRLRRAAVLATGLATVMSIAGYIGLSFTIDGLPAYPPEGWVAVIQPSTASDADTVQILVQAQTEGGQTRAAYDVVVCGPRPYSGDLLIGGTAQLTAARPDSPLPVSPAPHLQPISDLAFYYGDVIDLGAVQLVRISLPHVIACLPADAAQPAGILPGGSAEGVTGVTSGPVQQSWSAPWGLWHGPHAAQSWPLTGAFPGAPPKALGEYLALSGLSGSWSRPAQEYVQVTAAGVPTAWSIDSSVPSASGPFPLTWTDQYPVAPLVRLTDSSSIALLQNWVVIFAVAFGITGSVLASLLFEWLRRPSRHKTTEGSGPPPPHAHARARVPGGWPALAAVILIGYAQVRRARARHR
jgi:hypothetical protein